MVIYVLGSKMMEKFKIQFVNISSKLRDKEYNSTSWKLIQRRLERFAKER